MMEASGSRVLASLQAVADRQVDPAANVYARLFAASPELEALFVLDRDGGVRASMMQQALECILDHAEGGAMWRPVIAAARFHHDGYGVSPDRFDTFFAAIRDAFCEILGADWTGETDAAWAQMLDAFATAR